VASGSARNNGAALTALGAGIREIAPELEMSEGTVTTRIRRGLLSNKRNRSRAT
jgi:DNA-directed RNA polymerase specialized sigma24 family protein